MGVDAERSARYTTPLVGRGATLGLIEDALSSDRLVTLTGPAGVGKTRLAWAVHDAHAARFCDLSEAQDHEDIVVAVSAVVGPGGNADLGSLLERLGPCVLVLDNTEQVLEESAALIPRWLVDAPELRLLVTSRERLRLSNERVVPVPPLEVGEGLTAPATVLLLERIRRLQPGYDAVGDELDALRALTHQLEGFPLALELAAARMGTLSARAVLERLDRRLSLLRTRARDVPSRHRSLAAAVESSWELLDERERRTLARLSAFRGGLDLEGAEAVLEDLGLADELLESLVDRSLLRTVNRAGRRRFELFVSIREFADEQLEGAERENTFARHRDHYVHRAEKTTRDAHARGMDLLHRGFGAEWGNLRAALERSEGETAARAFVVLEVLGRHRSGGLLPSATVDRVVAEAPELPPDLAAEVLAAGSSLVLRSGVMASARALAERAIARVDEGDVDASVEARVRFLVAYVDIHAGRPVDAEPQLERAVTLGRGTGQSWLAARASLELAAAYSRHEHDEAARVLSETRSLVAQLDDAFLKAAGPALEAVLSLERGEPARALEIIERTQEQVARSGALQYELSMIVNQGLALAELGRPEEAIAVLDEAEVGARAARLHRVRAFALARRCGARGQLGDWAGALDDLDLALSFAQDLGEHRVVLGCSVAQTAALSALGRVGEAEASLALVAATVQGLTAARDGESPDERDRAMLRIAQAHLALARGDLEFARTVHADVATVDCAARQAHRTLGRALEEANVVLGPLLEATVDGRWFRYDGAEADLARRGPVRRVFAALLAARLDHPGVGLPLEALVSAGWPDERIHPDAAGQRAYQAVAELRRRGLKSVLLKHDDGYLLDPTVPVAAPPST